MESPGGRTSTGKQRKTKNEPNGVDFMSLIPEAIFLSILKRLNVNDLIIVSLVSRLWKAMVVSHLSAVPSALRLNEIVYVANFVSFQVPRPIPDFHGSQFQAHLINSAKRRYIDFVSRTLLVHKGCTIGSVDLCLCYDGTHRYSRKLTSWVVFLFTNEIGELSMDFSSGGPRTSLSVAHHFDLPRNSFSPRALVSLTLTLCNVRANTFGVMASLKTLKFARAKFFGCSLGKIASRCPALDDVALAECIFPDEFMVCARDLRIKSLTIVDCRTEELPMFSISISAPELLSLVIVGRYLMTSDIRNASRLQYASIDVMQIYADHVQGDAVASLLSGLYHCRTISMNSWCIQVLPTGEYLQDELCSPLTYVQHLRLTLALGKQELPGIACLIRSCPNLRTITLNLENSMVVDWAEFGEDIPDILDFEEETYWQSHVLPFQCMETTLKRVVINGFRSKVKEENIARFFLDNGTVLENMDLYIDSTHLSASKATEEQLSTMWYQDNTVRPIQIAPRLSNRAQVKVFVPSGPNNDMGFAYLFGQD